MVKPQAKHRPITPEDDDLNRSSQTSRDSYNNPVRSRRMPGLEAGILVPDFVVSRGGRDNAPDKLVLILESKLRELEEISPSERGKTLNQLTNCLLSLSADIQTKVYRILQTKTTVHVYVLVSDGTTIRPRL